MYAAGKPCFAGHTTPLLSRFTALAWDHRERHGPELNRGIAGTTGQNLATVHARMEREKRQRRANEDAQSAKLKDEGNTAFKKGDFKMAYVLYTACMHLCIRETLYPLNRAAVALKLKLYGNALQDANAVVEEENYNTTTLEFQQKLWIVENASEIINKANLHRIKGYFRRGQAWCFLGEWVKAEEDYGKALQLKLDDATIVREMDKLKTLRSLSAEEQAAWVSKQGKVTLLDIFEPGELKERIEELIGRKLEYTY
ncbi:hypothetical protein B0H19DRAFT_1147259 [Mycena capillaripes]|nr:hypothetical protein B0H19DRAFT_1147259 [Mycena capillaripes]